MVAEGDSLQRLFDRRVVLVTGKGGVGRTVVAAALALAASWSGRRVLLSDLGDPEGGDSPLAALFGRASFGPAGCDLGGGLTGCQLWSAEGHRRFFHDALPGGRLVSVALRARSVRAFLLAAPSLLEMGWLYHLLTLARAERSAGVPLHERIVLDMPATGHTLALTGLPGLLERLFPSGPANSALREGRAYLNDPARTQAVVVTLPETLPLSEAIELVEGLRQLEVPVGGVLVNRVPADPFSAEERRALSAAIEGRPVLGALGLRRIAQSEEALLRLRTALTLPLLTLPERPAQGFALVEALAHALSRPAPPVAARER